MSFGNLIDECHEIVMQLQGFFSVRARSKENLVPIQSHFRSRRLQAQLSLYQDAHTATGPAQDGHRPKG